MTKDAYYEMCEITGEQPLVENEPVEWQDLPEQVQQCFEVYSFLPDRWEGMSATFMGKDYSIVFHLLDTFQVIELDRLLYLRLMSNIDGIRSKLIQNKQKQKEKKPSQ